MMAAPSVSSNCNVREGIRLLLHSSRHLVIHNPFLSYAANNVLCALMLTARAIQIFPSLTLSRKGVSNAMWNASQLLATPEQSDKLLNENEC
jgi:hypothetical protein